MLGGGLLEASLSCVLWAVGVETGKNEWTAQLFSEDSEKKELIESEAPSGSFGAIRQFGEG